MADNEINFSLFHKGSHLSKAVFQKAKKEKDSSSFCSPEKKRIFAEKETFSSIPVDGKCRNASGPVEALQQ